MVCDSCTDNTQAIAEEYGATTVKVGYGRDGLTRNEGLARANGEYVLFMDDDDWWLHEYVLSQLNDKLEECSDIDVLVFSFIFKGWKYATPLGNYGRHFIACWCKCYRREFLKGCKFSGEPLSSDVTFFSMVMAKHPRLLDWDMPLYYYNYMREGSQTELDAKRRKK